MMSRMKFVLGLGVSSMGGSPEAFDRALAAQDLHHLEEAGSCRLAAYRDAGGMYDSSRLQILLIGHQAARLFDSGM